MNKHLWAIFQEKETLKNCIITELDRLKEEDISQIFEEIQNKNKESILKYINNLDYLGTLNLYEKLRIYLENQICFRIYSNHKIKLEEFELKDLDKNEINKNEYILYIKKSKNTKIKIN